MLLTTNTSRESIYCGIIGKIISLLIKILQDFVFSLPHNNSNNSLLHPKNLYTVKRVLPKYYPITLDCMKRE